MQVRRTRWNSGVKSVAVAIALALAVCGVLPALAENVVPVANAVPDQRDKALGTLITLDGSVSSDVNGDPLTYRWSLSSPAGSAAVLANPTSVMPTFIVDRAGIYTAQLIVHDGTLSSAPDSVIITSVDATPTGNRVFFRGGYAALTSDRGGELFTDGHTGQNDGTSGYYVGGGMDLMLTRDLWGMTKNIALLGEIGVEFKRFNSETVANSDTDGVTGVSNAGRNKEQITMLTVDIAPKVKFMQGTNFQPWIIPVGLDFHVISPTSSQTNYLDIGAQFGGGAEYRIWKELWLGMDGRFHLPSNQTNTTNNYGTVGAYVAIGF